MASRSIVFTRSGVLRTARQLIRARQFREREEHARMLRHEVRLHLRSQHESGDGRSIQWSWIDEAAVYLVATSRESLEELEPEEAAFFLVVDRIGRDRACELLKLTTEKA